MLQGLAVASWSVDHFLTQKQKTLENLVIIKGLNLFLVVPPGIEPGTHGFSVHCSTN